MRGIAREGEVCQWHTEDAKLGRYAHFLLTENVALAQWVRTPQLHQTRRPIQTDGFCRYRYTRIMTNALRGINLGGWQVAERWMTPDVFAGVKADGEIALVRELGRDTAMKRLQTHRSTFITEDDFKWVKGRGFDFVRLPVGYWLFEETDDFIDGEDYIRKAFEWASHNGLGVVLDFHGLQGSQNGYDHSGQPGKIRLYRRHNRKRALRTLEYLCRTYGKEEALIGLEIINEPQIRLWLYDWWQVLRFYTHAVRLAEGLLRPETKIIVSDAFHPIKMAEALSKRGYSHRVVMDMHLYRMFGDRHQSMRHPEHIAEVESEWSEVLLRVTKLIPVMIGEWSAALPATAYREINEEKEIACVEYFLSQQKLFDEMSWGHSYWSYKVPTKGVWDYRKISELVHKHRRASDIEQ